MNTDRILPVNKEHLLLMQVLCWLARVTAIRSLSSIPATSPNWQNEYESTSYFDYGRE